MKFKSLRGVTALLGMTAFLAHGMVRAAEPWSGFYAGLNGGRGTTNTEEIDNRLGQFKGDGSGGLAGIQLGYNYRLSSTFIVGFENSFAGTRIRSDGAGALAPQVKIPLLVAGRIRGGSLMFNERLFLYGTGGVAAGRLDDAGEKTDKYGWTAGAGMEWAWSPALSTNVEVLAYNLSRDWNKEGGRNTDMKFKTVTFGLNYHF